MRKRTYSHLPSYPSSPHPFSLPLPPFFFFFIYSILSLLPHFFLAYLHFPPLHFPFLLIPPVVTFLIIYSVIPPFLSTSFSPIYLHFPPFHFLFLLINYISYSSHQVYFSSSPLSPASFIQLFPLFLLHILIRNSYPTFLF